MSDEYTTELIEFITRSMEHIEFGRTTEIRGNFKKGGIYAYIEITKEED